MTLTESCGPACRIFGKPVYNMRGMGVYMLASEVDTTCQIAAAPRLVGKADPVASSPDRGGRFAMTAIG